MILCPTNLPIHLVAGAVSTKYCLHIPIWDYRATPSVPSWAPGIGPVEVNVTFGNKFEMSQKKRQK